MRILLVCPVPAEFGACRETFSMRDLPAEAGCRLARGVCGGAELLAVESGPAKARAASATMAVCLRHSPDLVLDTGACCGLEPGLAYGQPVLADSCLEYDIGGDKLPDRLWPEMRLPGALSFLDPPDREALLREAVEVAREGRVALRIGQQASGELFIRDLPTRQRLHELLRATGAAWETAGVFIAALRAGLPALSLRVVTDLGDESALRDFRRHVRPASRQLYRLLGLLCETGWPGALLEKWNRLPPQVRAGLSGAVRP